MASKDLRKQIKAAEQAFQADVDASVIHLDEPEVHGEWRMSWKVTMPEQEYDARLAELKKQRRAAEKAEEDEEVELAADWFMHETE